MRGRFGEAGEVRHGSEKLGEVFVFNIADKTICEVAPHLGTFHDKVLEAEVFVVEGVDDIAHGFDGVAHRASVLDEAGCRDIAGGESLMGKVGHEFVCVSTGRPSYGWNPKADLGVKKVPSVWQTNSNRDGDGEMKITVSNFTEEPLIIPALRRTDERILWEESLVVLINGQGFRAPSSRGVSDPTQPVTLAPDERISHVVNPLAIRNGPWPSTANSRLSFMFCLGNHAAKEHFYYFKSHHDAIRAKLLSGQPLRPDFLGD